MRIATNSYHFKNVQNAFSTASMYVNHGAQFLGFNVFFLESLNANKEYKMVNHETCSLHTHPTHTHTPHTHTGGLENFRHKVKSSI